MKNVSNAFKEKMTDRRDFYATAEITFTDGTVKTLSKADFNINGNTIVQGGATSSFPLGVLSSKQITLSLMNSDDRWADYDFYGAKIKLFTNFQTNNEPFDDSESFTPIIETIREGEFTVITPETYGTTVEITAMDESYKADEEYTSTLLFPAALDVALLDCCSTCGITLYSSNFPNKNFIIKEKPTDITFRQFIAYIAMIAGGNAVLDEYNHLKIMPYDLSPFDEEESENIPIIKEFKLGLNLEVNDVVITGVQTTGEATTSVTDEDGNVTEITEEKTYQYGEEGYMLSLDNVLVKGNEQEFINAVGQKLVGLKFRPFSGDSVANPLFEFMDCVYIQDIKGKQYQTIITDIDFTYFGFTGLKCTADSPLRVNRKYENAAAQAIIKARELVEQEKTEREKAIDRLNQMLEGSSGFYLTKDKQDDGSVIMYIHDKPTIEESKYVIKITGEAMAISNDGGETYIYGLTYDGEAILRKIYAEGIDADYITTGHLLADLIQGGTLTLGGLDNEFGILKMLDNMGEVIGEWSKNGITAQAGTIGGFTIDSEKIYAKIRESSNSTEPLYIVVKGNDSFSDRSFLKKYWKTLDGMENALDRSNYQNNEEYKSQYTNGQITGSLKLNFTSEELKGLTYMGEQIQEILINHNFIDSGELSDTWKNSTDLYTPEDGTNTIGNPKMQGSYRDNFKLFSAPNVWLVNTMSSAIDDTYTPDTSSYLPYSSRYSNQATGFYPLVRFLTNETAAEYPSSGYFKSEWWCQIIEEGGRKALKLRNRYTDTKMDKLIIEWEWFYCDDETDFLNIIDCVPISDLIDARYKTTINPSLCWISNVTGVEVGNQLSIAIESENEDSASSGKPYQVDGSLWFYPVQSQNVPDFEGIYFCKSYLENMQFKPDNPPEPFKSVVESTIFCESESKAASLREAGFTHAINAYQFNGDTWIMNGESYEFSAYRGINSNNAFYCRIENDQGSFDLCRGYMDYGGPLFFATFKKLANDENSIQYYYCGLNSTSDGYYKVGMTVGYTYSKDIYSYQHIVKDIVDPEEPDEPTYSSTEFTTTAYAPENYSNPKICCVAMEEWGTAYGQDYLNKLKTNEYGFVGSYTTSEPSQYPLTSQQISNYASLLDNNFFYRRITNNVKDLEQRNFKFKFQFNLNDYKSEAAIYIGVLSPNTLWRNAIFKSDENGNIKATSGEFENVNIKGALFAGTLNAATGTFTGELQAATGTFSGTLTTGDLSTAGFKIENGRILGYKNGNLSSYFSSNATFTVDEEVLPALRISSYGGLALYGKHLGVCRDYVDVGEGGMVDMGGNGTIQVITGIELVNGELSISYRNLRFTNGVMTTALE